jgi:hypothetical protein
MYSVTVHVRVRYQFGSFMAHNELSYRKELTIKELKKRKSV